MFDEYYYNCIEALYEHQLLQKELDTRLIAADILCESGQLIKEQAYDDIIKTCTVDIKKYKESISDKEKYIRDRAAFISKKLDDYEDKLSSVLYGSGQIEYDDFHFIPSNLAYLTELSMITSIDKVRQYAKSRNPLLHGTVMKTVVGVMQNFGAAADVDTATMRSLLYSGTTPIDVTVNRQFTDYARFKEMYEMPLQKINCISVSTLKKFLSFAQKINEYERLVLKKFDDFSDVISDYEKTVQKMKSEKNDKNIMNAKRLCSDETQLCEWCTVVIVGLFTLYYQLVFENCDAALKGGKL